MARVAPPRDWPLRARARTHERGRPLAKPQRGWWVLNLVLDFLARHAQQLELDRYDVGRTPSFVLVTPRSENSKYVVFMILRRESSRPALVAKLARLPAASRMLEREAVNLRAVQEVRPDGFDTIPRVVAFAEHRHHQILLQTALAGRGIDSVEVRRHPPRTTAGVLAWLRELPIDNSSRDDLGWYERLVVKPITTFGALFPPGSDQERLARRTLELVEPLRDAHLPLVIEHGDLMEPNLIRLRDGRVGVVDWELAERRGLPLSDLFLFLSYFSLATEKAWQTPRRLRAFERTFFQQQSAPRIVADEAERLAIEHSLLRPLFIACWARYVSGIVARDEPWRRPVAKGEPPPAEHVLRWTTAYVERNTHYALWRRAVERAEALRWHSGG